MKNKNAGFITQFLLAFIAVIIIGGGAYMYQNKKASLSGPVSNEGENITANFGTSTAAEQPVENKNKNASLNVATDGWKRYDPGRGFEFKYPSYFSIDSLTTENNVVLCYEQADVGYNQTGQQCLSVIIEDSTQNLEQNVRESAKRQTDFANDAGSKLVVTFDKQTIGNVQGYVILNKSADVLRNTTAQFKTKVGNKIVTFTYDYHGYILLKDPSQATGGAPITEGFKTDVSSRLKVYNDIQTIISTFRFF